LIIPIISELCFKSAPSDALLDENQSIIIAINENFEGPPHVTGIGNGMFAMPGTPPKIGSFIHELGHIWGHFEEEYPDVYIPQSRNYNNVFNVDAEGCPKWCSGTLNTTSFCYSDYLWYQDCTSQIPDPPQEHIEEWMQCFVLAQKEGRNLPMCNLGIECIEDAGCYWSAESISDWRAYPITVMVGGSYWDEFGYGYGMINEQYLSQRLAELADGSITIPPSETNLSREAKAKIENEGELKSVKIEAKENKLELTVGNTSVLVHDTLQVSDKKLFIIKNNVRNEVGVLPDVAIKTAQEKGLQLTEQTQLKEESQGPAYSIKGTKQTTILFIIPVQMRIEMKIDAQTNEIIEENKPWWGFLTI
jgi:hypothetical protein